MSLTNFDLRHYNKDKEKVLPVNGQPLSLFDFEIAAVRLGSCGGFSHALMEIINAIRRTRNAKKSYAVISIAPFQGLRIDRLPFMANTFS